MQSHRIISGLTIALMVILVAAGWLLVAQPQLASAASAGSQLTDVQTQIASTQASIIQLKGQQKELPALKKDLATLRLSIPGQADTSVYISDLDALAATAGVTIQGLTVSNAAAYTPPVTAPAAPAAGGAAPTPTPTPTPSASPTTVPIPVGWQPAVDSRINGTNFVAIPVTIVTAGTWDATLSFFKGLQSGKRLFLIENIGTTPSSAAPSVVTATIGGYIYVLIDPKSDGSKNGTTTNDAATATPTPTATPTATTSPSGPATPTPTQSPTPTTKP